MKSRIVVGAHYGLKDWLAQRITAIIMAIYTLVVAVALCSGAAESQESWRALMSNGYMRFITPLFMLSLCYHAWVGVRDIWMDYVKCAALRLTLHSLTVLVLVGYAVWGVQIIWRL
ncbi:succinate dehydrogenase, hydrophobic membrane anchor protein [Denitratisoma sp. DHT3]|uniref:succinate dehydrogenase, hydrophobic membrane anchor protein n=1 Tax=Denitratisoma sp. DHT3 TaxID=1981880 RepID=UPI001198AA3B|nr:succinate dehydrogenase, hydrophobic membrane anchor protein [Denitratisoma sp. DHT3]QDX80466.1 succinate dehydrogenase, hydrophobic membrane anchor protein [Denitratisoma sp. DHT3]